MTVTPLPGVLCETCGCLCLPGEDCPACLVVVEHAAAVEGRQQCTNCTGWYPVLVDDVLCIRCDSILYPTSTIPAAAPTLATAPDELREAS